MAPDPHAHLTISSFAADDAVMPHAAGDFGEDGTLRLLRACVEAMSLLQAKMEGFDRLVEVAGVDTRKEIANLRVEFAGALGTQSRDGARLTEVESQLDRMRTGNQDVTKRLADDIAGARAEASHWRMRVETDAMAFEQLSGRIGTLEEGFMAKLTATEQNLQEREQALAERTEENNLLRSETRVVEAASERLRSRLTTLESTIAEQRARITCLQNKLATATYAMRLDHMSRSMDGVDATPGPDILDLAPPLPGRARSSAA